MKLQEREYSVDYWDQYGAGTARIRLKHDGVLGEDSAGGVYLGHLSYNPKTDIDTIEVQMGIPSGTMLVADGRPRTTNEKTKVIVRMESDQLGSPIPAVLAEGPVSVVVRPI